MIGGHTSTASNENGNQYRFGLLFCARNVKKCKTGASRADALVLTGGYLQRLLFWFCGVKPVSVVCAGAGRGLRQSAPRRRR